MIAFLMGLVQGITEFLPISSSGHLQMFALLFSTDAIPMLFSIILHIATLVAVLIFTHRFLKRFIRSVIRTVTGKSDAITKNDMKILGYILVSTLATAPAAFYMKFSLFEQHWFVNNESRILGLCFFITAIILLLPTLCMRKTRINATSMDHQNYTFPSITMNIAICVGLLQGLAALPGISRSGITIAIALLLGASRSDAGYFSFLISIPTILASFLLSVDEIDSMLSVFTFPQIVLGMLAALLSGLLMLHTLFFIVRKGRMWLFSFYLIPLSLIMLFY